MTWDEARLDRLRELWPTTSARDIARELNVTRNAVIGKARRLRLQAKALARGPKPGAGKPPSKNPKKKPGRIVAEAGLIVSRTKPAPIVAEPPPPPSPIDGGISILDLENHHCRQIIGVGLDQLARFCGHPKSIEPLRYGGQTIRSAYCRAHAKINYRSS